MVRIEPKVGAPLKKEKNDIIPGKYFRFNEYGWKKR